MKPIQSKEPKLATLILTAVSGILLGALLGVWLALTEPATVVSQPPEEKAPGDYTAYYVAGKASGAETPVMRSALSRIQRRTPGPVSFAEEELNYYLGQLKPAEPNPGDPEEKARVERLNVRLEGDQMHASMRVILDPKGDRFEMLVQAEIDFVNTDDGPELIVESVRVNSMRLPTLGGVFSSLVKSRLAEAEWPEEYVEMWNNVRAIDLEAGTLIAEVGLRRPLL